MKSTLSSMLIVCLVASALPVTAQDARPAGQNPGQDRVVSRSFAELQGRLSPGQTVYVMDERHRETKGKIQAFSARTLRLAVGGHPQEFAEHDVAAITERHGHAMTGALIGLAVGGGLSLWYMAGCGNDPECAALRPLALGFGAGLGALGGDAIGAAVQSHQVLYLAPNQAPSRAFSVAPFVGSKRNGVLATIRF